MDRRIQLTHNAADSVRAPAAGFRWRAVAWVCACALALSGCSSQKWIVVRDQPHNPISERLMLLSRGGPKPTERTRMFLRKYDLEGDVDKPQELVARVQKVMDREPSSEAVGAAAELSYIGGVRAQLVGKSQEALDLYGTSAAYSHDYLLNANPKERPNTYDPQFRGACDLYNASLEASLRILKRQGKLRPGETFDVEAKGRKWEVTVTPRNVPWPAEEIERFEFVSDYEIQGLTNNFHTYGLGVPLIAVRKAPSEIKAAEKHCAPGVCFPVTALLRCEHDNPNALQADGKRHHRAVLEFYDPLQSTGAVVDGQQVPLESDITTPLAYALNHPDLQQLDQPTTGLLHPDRVKKMAGIYMLEPYQPGKIPVLMVHGLWSSPITWMEMFNDLRGDPDLRRDYQFWFYLYPTGQPFWRSGTQLRNDLVKLRRELDPSKQEASLDQMVLVGHSMGGLISHMQVANSRDDFWKLVSDRPFQEVKADEKTRRDLERQFYFEASPSVRRIVTIGTPHRGSTFANEVTRYLGQRLITLPTVMTSRLAELRRENPGFFRDTKMLDTATSIDSLAPDSPALPALLAAQRPTWVPYHNIVGRLPRDDWQSRLFGDGDGVVPYESAHLEYASSEIEVPAEHSAVHRHPQTILQVREILRQHLQDLNAFPRLYPESDVDRTAASKRTNDTSIR
jgi:pimeloyl-ACP methyl ester carboxylesterase